MWPQGPSVHVLVVPSLSPCLSISPEGCSFVQITFVTLSNTLANAALILLLITTFQIISSLLMLQLKLPSFLS